MADPSPTPNIHLQPIAANRRTWAEIMNQNLSLIDAVIGTYFTVQDLQGPWQNSTAYEVGQAVVDTDTSAVYLCQVAHTSSTIPTTFAEDRATYADYWTVYSTPARARGAWVPFTAYAVNDFVVSGPQYAVCVETHISGAEFSADASKWSILVDLSAAGSQVLPVPGGIADANKFVTTTVGGTGYAINDVNAVLAILGATVIGKAVFQAANTGDALTALGAQPAGSYQPLDADLTSIAGNGVSVYGLSLLLWADALAARASITPLTTNGDLWTRTGGVDARLAPGTNGQFLSMAAGLPAWASTPPVQGHIYGLTLSTAGSSATFGIATGRATDSTVVSSMALGSAYTKTTSSWALGTATGSLDTGSIANNTWYHVFLIQRPDTGVVDVLLSLSATAPTMPTNYTLFRRIGSMKTNGSAQWVTFLQVGDAFHIVYTSNLSGTGYGYQLTTLASIPTGVVVFPFLTVNLGAGAGAGTTVQFGPGSSTTLTTQVYTADNSAAFGAHWPAPEIPSNISGQIAISISGVGATVFVHGWRDFRGKDY